MSEWIPVSKKLPDKSGEYLVHFNETSHNILAIYGLKKEDIPDLNGWYGPGFYNPAYNWGEYDGYQMLETPDYWMSIPEPPKHN